MSAASKTAVHGSRWEVPAKILRPRFKKVFPRSRLFHWLDEALERPLVWICGPPGAGKTTLASSYVEYTGLTCLWYQLDVRDADPATFFHFLGLAASKAAPKQARSLPKFSPEYQRNPEVFCRYFFETLFARFTPPFLLILDNHHELPADAPVQKLLGLGLEQIPPGGRVILLSRDGLPPAFAGYRLKNAVSLLEWNELRFTEEETREFLHWQGQHTLPEENVSKLHRQTQGWVAGLILSLEQLTRSPDPWLQEDELLPQSLLDFFTGDLFAGLPAYTRDLLLQTAFLPRMTAAMSQALTGDRRAGRVLRELSHRNYFVNRRPGRRPVYEYHPLFRDFLRSRAEDSWTSERLNRIKRRAGNVLENHGQFEAALELYWETGDWPAMVRLLLGQAPEFLARGQTDVLEKWLQCLPGHILDGQPWLVFWLACCRMTCDPAQARRLFDDTRLRFRKQDDRKGWLLAWSGAVDALILESSSCNVMNAYIEEMEKTLAQVDRYPSRDVQARVAYAMFCALFLCRPDHPDLRHWSAEVENLCLRTDDIDLRLKSAYALTLHRLWSGDLTGAGMIVATLPAVDERETASPLVRLRVITIQARYYWLAGAPERTLDKLEEGLALSQRCGLSVGLDHLMAMGVAAAYSMGDLQRADVLLQRLGPRIHRARLIDAGLHRYLLAWGALLKGDLSAAERYADPEQTVEQRLGYRYGIAITHIGRAQLYCLQHRWAEAQTALTEAYAQADAVGSRLLQFMTGVVEVSLALEQGKNEEALNVLGRTLALGRRQGIFNFYGWVPEIMTRMCLKALEAGIEVDYVRNLIRKRRLIPPDPPLEIPHWPWPIRIYTLGRFSVLLHDRPVRFAGKAQKRPLELLQALIAFGGREIAIERLADALWPDADGEAGYEVVRVNLKRLRKLLGDNAAIELSAGRVTLDPHRCWVDAWAFERLLTENKVVGCATACLERALALYHGPFLSHQPEVAWLLPLRMRLQRKLLQAVVWLGKCYERQDCWQEAIQCYQKGLDVEPVAEVLYQRLMYCYLHQGRRADALRSYHQCRQILELHLGTGPSAETEALYLRLRT